MWILTVSGIVEVCDDDFTRLGFGWIGLGPKKLKGSMPRPALDSQNCASVLVHE